MESDFIAWLRQRLAGAPRLEIGLGDDAALWRLPGQALIATSDLLTDGVDFELADCDPRRVGRKSMAVNLSDLAAMAARPQLAIVSLALPRDGALSLAKELYEGLLPLADQYQCVIAGGDTNVWEGQLVVSVTAIGEPTGDRALRRSGAAPGDLILVTGSLGGSLLSKHFDFEPRVSEAIQLHSAYRLSAATDISDGLLRDVDSVARESGCGAVVRVDDIPISADATRMSGRDGRSPLEHALHDGEDFELVLAAAPDVGRQILNDQPLDIPIHCIGELVERKGLWSHNGLPLKPGGFEH